MSSEKLVILGFAIVIIGMLVMMFGAFGAAEKVEGGGVVVIGPFPIVFGSSENIAKIMMVVGIIIVLIFIVLSLLLWRGPEFIFS